MVNNISCDKVSVNNCQTLLKKLVDLISLNKIVSYVEYMRSHIKKNGRKNMVD